MTSKLSRRDFLKLSGVSLAGLAFSPYLPPHNEFLDGPLARVTTTQVSIHKRPDDQSAIVGQAYRDQVLNIYEEINSGTPGYNPVWYRVWGGYVHRARMQKVQYIYNQPAQPIRETGQLAEVTTPYTQVMRKTGARWVPLYRLYYTTVHWVVGLDEGPDGEPWYRLLDELLDITYHAPAAHLRLIPDEELTSISSEVPFEQKRIEVDLRNQVMTCFENNETVFSTLIASGRLSSQPGPNGIPTRTPAGKARINVKMPSKHMGNGNMAADIEAYELPGVAWTVFFKYDHLPFQGHAFHGTYWHDNFGVPMSSGCINMRTDEAKWLFRWCLPTASAEEIHPLTLDKKGYGTPVTLTQ